MKKKVTISGLKTAAAIVLGCLILSGCSTTKRLQESEVLYTGVKKMRVESMTDEDVPSSVESAVEDPLNVKPNNPLYSPYVRTPLPTGLWAWNYLYTERTTGFKAWLYRMFAKQPVLVSELQPEPRMDMVEDILDNLGYFGSSADYEILLKRNPKKARMNYNVRVAPPWFYGSVEYPDSTGPITTLIRRMQRTSNIVTGAQYNVDTLERERIRIANHLRNRSYYYFRPDYIEYFADTTRTPYVVDMRMRMVAGIPPAAMQPYRIGTIDVQLFNPLGGERDSTSYNGISIHHDSPLKLRKKVLARALTITPGDPTSVRDINNTLTNLSELGIFRYVNMAVTPLDSLAAGDRFLDMTISAAFDAPLDADFEVDFSSKSNSFIGPGLIFGVRHKNFLRGGEVFSVRLNGAYEWQTGNTSSAVNSTSINSYELGLNSSLTFPRLLVPSFLDRGQRRGSNTAINLGATLLNRPSYFTMLSANFSLSYNFQTSRHSSHSLSIFGLSYNNLLRTTSDFDAMMANNEAVRMSFQNQFIPSASYTYTYDKPIGRNRARSRRSSNYNRIIWQTTFKTSGNILSGVGGLLGNSRPRKIFGQEFSQFVKLQTELKYYHRLGENSTLAARLLLGAGYAYDNSTVMPYSDQFYIGGANSIRAFTVRSLGPGSYRPSQDDVYGYFDQTGDLKLEANLEYRFKLLGRLSGALFIDAGNIWLTKEDPARPGAKFTLNNFFDNLATGTGVGLRYDISYLVIRADLGVGIHTPYDNPNKSGYYNIPSFSDGLGFHLAIGYPF